MIKFGLIGPSTEILKWSDPINNGIPESLSVTTRPFSSTSRFPFSLSSWPHPISGTHHLFIHRTTDFRISIADNLALQTKNTTGILLPVVSKVHSVTLSTSFNVEQKMHLTRSVKQILVTTLHETISLDRRVGASVS